MHIETKITRGITRILSTTNPERSVIPELDTLSDVIFSQSVDYRGLFSEESFAFSTAMNLIARRQSHMISSGHASLPQEEIKHFDGFFEKMAALNCPLLMGADSGESGQVETSLAKNFALYVNRSPHVTEGMTKLLTKFLTGTYRLSKVQIEELFPLIDRIPLNDRISLIGEIVSKNEWIGEKYKNELKGYIEAQQKEVTGIKRNATRLGENGEIRFVSIKNRLLRALNGVGLFSVEGDDSRRVVYITETNLQHTTVPRDMTTKITMQWPPVTEGDEYVPTKLERALVEARENASPLPFDAQVVEIHVKNEYYFYDPAHPVDGIVTSSHKSYGEDEKVPTDDLGDIYFVVMRNQENTPGTHSEMPVVYQLQRMDTGGKYKWEYVRLDESVGIATLSSILDTAEKSGQIKAELDDNFADI